MNASETLAELRTLFAKHGQQSYGEQVTMAEHALLTAQAARDAGAQEALVVAALLRDIGHFLDEPDDEFGLHDHGALAAGYLADRFPLAVTEPIRLHIDAKRYLCALEAGYLSRLSEASRHTLAHQGGPMTAAEAAAFAELPYAEDAISLRRWEDLHGKDPGSEVPSFSSFEDS